MLLVASLLLLYTGISAHGVFDCTQTPGKLKQIDAGAGEVWGVNAGDDIFLWEDKIWKKVPGSLKHVSPGAAGVWGVNKHDKIYRYEENEWIPVSGLLKQVDAGGNKFLSGTNSGDEVYCLRQSCTISGYSSVRYDRLDLKLKYYTCGPMGCWGVTSKDDIYFRNNVSPTSCIGNYFQKIDGYLTMVEVGADGSVYGVNSAGNVYRRLGVTPQKPTGTTWELLDFCDSFTHVTYDNGTLWLLKADGDIFQCKEY